jgi:hypothetical protein
MDRTDAAAAGRQGGGPAARAGHGPDADRTRRDGGRGRPSAALAGSPAPHGEPAARAAATRRGVARAPRRGRVPRAVAHRSRAAGPIRPGRDPAAGDPARADGRRGSGARRASADAVPGRTRCGTTGRRGADPRRIATRIPAGRRLRVPGSCPPRGGGPPRGDRRPGTAARFRGREAGSSRPPEGRLVRQVADRARRVGGRGRRVEDQGRHRPAHAGRWAGAVAARRGVGQPWTDSDSLRQR